MLCACEHIFPQINLDLNIAFIFKTASCDQRRMWKILQRISFQLMQEGKLNYV